MEAAKAIKSDLGPDFEQVCCKQMRTIYIAEISEKSY